MLPAALLMLLAGSAAASPLPARADDGVALEVTIALLTADLPGAQLEAAAAQGAVVLRGHVASSEQKARAETLARAVPGVSAVRSAVRVAPVVPSAPADDRLLREHVARSLGHDASWLHVDAVRQGRVSLRGSGEPAALVRALRVVRETPGVASVTLVRAALPPLAPRAAAPGPRALAGGTSPDFWVTLKTKMALFATRGVHGLGVSVDTTGGTVTLRGRVESKEERARIEQTARAVRGAREVVDAIEVVARPRAPLTAAEEDEQIQRLVRLKLAADGSMNGIAVAEVSAGTVVLKGKAGLAETLRAIALATSVPGVRGVNSQIRAPESDYSRESRLDDRTGGGSL